MIPTKTTAQRVVEYFGPVEIEKSPMFANTTTSEYEAAETYESPLAFVEICIAKYPNEIKLDDELSMCKLAMFLHLDCRRFAKIVRQRILEGHLDFMYIDLEKTFEDCPEFEWDEMDIAFFLHTLQFSPMRAITYGQNVSRNYHVSFKNWVFASFPIFRLFYNALKAENLLVLSWFYEHISDCVSSFEIEFAPYLMELYERFPEEMFTVLYSCGDSNLVAQFFEKIVNHYATMERRKFERCTERRSTNQPARLHAASFMSKMIELRPDLYNEFKSLFSVDEGGEGYYPYSLAELPR